MFKTGTMLRVGALPDCRSAAELQQAASGLENLIGECIQASRSLSAGMSPPVLYQNGLAAGLTWLAAWMCEYTVQNHLQGIQRMLDYLNFLLLNRFFYYNFYSRCYSKMNHPLRFPGF